MPPSAAPDPVRRPASTARARVAELVDRYGRSALLTWFVLALLVYAAFAVAIRAGMGTATAASVFGGAWLGLKATQPLRLAATVALTPVVSRLLAPRGQRAQPPRRSERASSSAPISPTASESGERTSSGEPPSRRA